MGRWGGTGRLGRRELQRRQNLLGTVRKKKGANKGEVPLRALQLRVEGQKSLPFIRGVKSLGPAKDITQVWSGSAILSLQLLQTQCLAWGQKGKRRKEQAFLRGGFVMGVSQTPVTCQAVQTAGDAGLPCPSGLRERRRKTASTGAGRGRMEGGGWSQAYRGGALWMALEGWVDLGRC